MMRGAGPGPDGARWLLPVLATALLAACGDGAVAPVDPAGLEVLAVLPHDTTAFTQGLAFHGGYLYESTGRYGASSVRRLDPATGAVLDARALGPEHFGEGLAVVEGRLLQLTWKEKVAFLYDAATLAPRDTVPFDSDGWGACWDGEAVLTTSGGPVLRRRDPATLEVTGQVQVTEDGEPLWQVNELECVPPHVLGNVFGSDDIVRIDAATGEVLERIDLASLVPEELRGSPDAVANGIAWDPASDTYYLTGKLWPVLYRVRLR